MSVESYEEEIEGERLERPFNRQYHIAFLGRPTLYFLEPRF